MLEENVELIAGPFDGTKIVINKGQLSINDDEGHYYLRSDPNSNKLYYVFYNKAKALKI